MSTVGADAAGNRPAGWSDLEEVVERLLVQHEGLRRRLRAAEARVRELEEALRGVSTGTLDPTAMASELEQLRHQNTDLEARMEEARARVERVVARLRFVEDAS